MIQAKKLLHDAKLKKEKEFQEHLLSLKEQQQKKGRQSFQKLHDQLNSAYCKEREERKKHTEGSFNSAGFIFKKESVKEQIIEYEKDRFLQNAKYDNIEKNDVLGEEEVDILEMNISKIVSASITKTLILIIMGMIFILPLLDWGFWEDTSLLHYNSLAYYIESITIKNDNLSQFNETLMNYIHNNTDSSYPIVNITSSNITNIFINATINGLIYRNEEIGTIFSPNSIIVINYLLLQKNSINAIINLTRTVFLCIVLVVCSFMFEDDANTLVLRPLSVMFHIISTIVKDPIGARNIEAMQIIQEVEMKIEEQNEKEKEKEKELPKIDPTDPTQKYASNNIFSNEGLKVKEILEEHAEVKVIQESIIKISALLAIGFGEAGSDIIKSNLKTLSDLDPMMKGLKKTAFFGFCDIRDFLKINEALKEDSVIFVNRIAEIVHKSVDKFGGATNKNIGDAFLNVWKFPQLNPKHEEYEISPQNIYSKQVADKAVLSFLYILRAIKLNQDVLEYSHDPRIKQLFPHGWKVNMGFGIHYGWAIEGTVGSKHKIDASYLSPNVNIAARLEAATRQYKVSILISGSVYDFLSSELKSVCREIDRVTVKGSLSEVRLFTIDVNLKHPGMDKVKRKYSTLCGNEKIKKFLEKKMLYKNFFDKCDTLFALNFQTSFFLKKIGELFVEKMSDNFYENFDYGFEKYIEGKWEEAEVYFKKCLLINEDDGPTNVLLNYMSEYSFKSPANWKGFRELTSK